MTMQGGSMTLERWRMTEQGWWMTKQDWSMNEQEWSVNEQNWSTNKQGWSAARHGWSVTKQEWVWWLSMDKVWIGPSESVCSSTPHTNETVVICAWYPYRHHLLYEHRNVRWRSSYFNTSSCFGNSLSECLKFCHCDSSSALKTALKIHLYWNYF